MSITIRFSPEEAVSFLQTIEDFLTEAFTDAVVVDHNKQDGQAIPGTHMWKAIDREIEIIK